MRFDLLVVLILCSVPKKLQLTLTPTDVSRRLLQLLGCDFFILSARGLHDASLSLVTW